MSQTPLQMVDLKSQYLAIKYEMDNAILDVVQSTQYINGPVVKSFEKNLASYLQVSHVIGCANGTDALQIALMALGLVPGDEVIVPSFTYVATAEVIALLQLKPIMVDVDLKDFNTTASYIEAAITEKTKAIVPVHLFGQSCDMESIMEIAERNNLYVVEDNAQAIGSEYQFKSGKKMKTGTIGHIGTTSFFPSKNLGCYGDGGAIFTQNDDLAEKIRMIANHGQSRKYYHDIIGCNSRLDSIQAAVLNVKLRHLDDYCNKRRTASAYYNQAFTEIEKLQIPYENAHSTHVYHQYTLKVSDGKRDALHKHLSNSGIPSAIYYPVPLNKQKAFQHFVPNDIELKNTEDLCQSVLSLPIHTEMNVEIQEQIINGVKDFFNN